MLLPDMHGKVFDKYTCSDEHHLTRLALRGEVVVTVFAG